MGIACRTEGIATDRADLAEPAIGLINPVLTVDDKGGSNGEMTVQQDLFVGIEFDNEIDDIPFFIDKENRGNKMLEISEPTPLDIAIVELVGGHWGCDDCHSSFSLRLGFSSWSTYSQLTNS
jgi:hypothetical protein